MPRSSFSTAPIFTEEFYSHPQLFSRPNAFPNLCRHSRYHAIVDDDNSIRTIPFTFFQHVMRFFSFRVDDDLFLVNCRLKELELHLGNAFNAEIPLLKQEIHTHGLQGAQNLKVNLQQLSVLFAHGNNEKSILTRTLLKIFNFILKLFNRSPIEFHSYQDIDLNRFSTQVIDPALELTPIERAESPFYAMITNTLSSPLPEGLTPENLQKLQYGLLNSLRFTLDRQDLSISYNSQQEQFYLSAPVSGRSLESLRVHAEYYHSQSPPASITEIVNDQHITHDLHTTTTYSYQGRSCCHRPVETYSSHHTQIPLIPDNEYWLQYSPTDFISLQIRRRQ